VLKEEEVTGGWRKLHNEQLHDLYQALNIISVLRLRRIGRVGHVACIGEGRLACRVVVERGTILRVRDSIEMEFIGQGGDGVDWINVTGDRDRRADCLEHCNETWVLYRAGNLLTG